MLTLVSHRRGAISFLGFSAKKHAYRKVIVSELLQGHFRSFFLHYLDKNEYNLMASSAVGGARAADPQGVVLTEGVSEDLVVVARATTCFKATVA